MTTVGTIITNARLHHALFHRDAHPDRACVAFLSMQHRIHWKALAHQLKDRLSQAREIADTISDSLVGVDADGNLYQVSTEGDGYAVALDGGGFLYLVGDPITLDPYSDGFPLPSGAIEIIHILATFSDNSQKPVVWQPQADVGNFSGYSDLRAFVNGWRLFPIKNPTDGTHTPWEDVTSVTIHWVDDVAAFSALTDTIALPAVYEYVLEAELVAFLASRQSALTPEDFPPALAAQMGEVAMRDVAKLTAGTELDHRRLRVSQARRNR